MESIMPTMSRNISIANTIKAKQTTVIKRYKIGKG